MTGRNIGITGSVTISAAAASNYKYMCDSEMSSQLLMSNSFRRLERRANVIRLWILSYADLVMRVIGNVGYFYHPNIVSFYERILQNLYTDCLLYNVTT